MLEGMFLRSRTGIAGFASANGRSFTAWAETIEELRGEARTILENRGGCDAVGWCGSLFRFCGSFLVARSAKANDNGACNEEKVPQEVRWCTQWFWIKERKD